MKKFASISFCVLVLLGFFYLRSFQKEKQTNLHSSLPTPVSKADLGKEERFLFVPYWTLTSETNDSNFDSLIYFGVTADEKGVNKEDSGYQNIGQFENFFNSGKKKYLAVRMINSDVNSTILKDKELQKKIIDESINIAKENSFDGLVLDFEMSALPFESLINRISDFVVYYNKSVKNNNLDFYITLYGDTFYRVRPYDVDRLAKNSDKVLVMAYDLHKAKGDPGPNFPLGGREEYGYDFKTMISDFLKVIPREKLMVVFGLYGYDWTVAENNQSKEQAQALTFNEIKNKFLNNCDFKNCTIKRDVKSAETEIEYTDNNNERHTVWFEDEKSVDAKIKFLKDQGINQVSYWAFSYF